MACHGRNKTALVAIGCLAEEVLNISKMDEHNGFEIIAINPKRCLKPTDRIKQHIIEFGKINKYEFDGNSYLNLYSVTCDGLEKLREALREFEQVYFVFNLGKLEIDSVVWSLVTSSCRSWAAFKVIDIKCNLFLNKKDTYKSNILRNQIQIITDKKCVQSMLLDVDSMLRQVNTRETFSNVIRQVGIIAKSAITKKM